MNTRTALRVIVVTIMIVGITFTGFQIYTKVNDRRNANKRIETIPSFMLESLSGDKVTRKNTSKKPLWLIFFHSDCEYCQMQVNDIAKMNNVSTIQIWLVSSEPKETISEFAKKNNLNKLNNLQLLNDSQDEGHRTFGVTTSPASFLYNKEGNLIKKYKGIVKTETILKVIRDNEKQM